MDDFFDNASKRHKKQLSKCVITDCILSNKNEKYIYIYRAIF